MESGEIGQQASGSLNLVFSTHVLTRLANWWPISLILTQLAWLEIGGKFCQFCPEMMLECKVYSVKFLRLLQKKINSDI